MSSLKGQVVTYFIERSQGKPVSMATLLKLTGTKGGPEGRRRIQGVINGIKRQGGPIAIETLVGGEVWVQTDWAEMAAQETEPPREVVAELEDEDEDPGQPVNAAPHVCAFEVVGRTTGDSAVLIIRNSVGEIFKAVPIS